jgi:hypothetical protein
MKSAVLKKDCSSCLAQCRFDTDRFHRQEHAGDPLVALVFTDGKGHVSAAQHRMPDVLHVEVGPPSQPERNMNNLSRGLQVGRVQARIVANWGTVSISS